MSTLLKDERVEDWLIRERNLWRKIPLPELYRDLSRAGSGCETFLDLALCFRTFKQRHFVRLAGRDLFQLAPFPEIVSQVSELARVCLQVGMHLFSSRPELWAPSTIGGNLPDFSNTLGILGMGKLGGGELNFVSDVDLIFLREARNTDGEDKRAQSLFCQALSKLMSASVGGDRVFLVDMRLRPGGKDGELIVSVDRALDHYQIQGRTWERQALLKARPVAGQSGICNTFLEQVRPFVFRRFLDFQALDELKAMRDNLLRETQQAADGPFNVKLGPGGIREIEFVVQSLQLVYGGRFPELDEPNTVHCLQRLQELDVMSPETVTSMSAAYILLRRVEHWLQLDHNRQTHTLPQSEAGMERLAMVLDYSSGRELDDKLREVRDVVHEQFSALFRPSSPPGTQTAESGEDKGEGEAGDQVPVPCPPFSPQVSRAVQSVLSHLHRTGGHAWSEKWPLRLRELVHKLSLRPGLVVLLNESSARERPAWLEELLYCTAGCQFVASLLLHQPGLVEGLPQHKRHGPGRGWNVDAEHIVDHVRGYEQGVEWIRRLKNERMLALVLDDVHGRLGLEELETGLSDLAEWVVQSTWKLITREFAPGSSLPVALMALGKMGSREMGYLSDVDLTFVYDPPESGQEVIPEQVVKLIQRFMRMLSTPLQEGPGYSVDAQLRPSGNYGPLIVTRARWEDYYHREADIWEVQTLLRMRTVAGDPDVGKRLESMARQLCFRSREANAVWPRMCHLRRRMEQERSRERESSLDIKLGPGGLVDVEFLAQGSQLTRGQNDERLHAAALRDMFIPAGEALGLNPYRVQTVWSWYRSLRSLELRMQLLTNQPVPVLTADDFALLQNSGLWPAAGGGEKIETWPDIRTARRTIRQAWDEVCAHPQA